MALTRRTRRALVAITCVVVASLAAAGVVTVRSALDGEGPRQHEVFCRGLRGNYRASIDDRQTARVARVFKFSDAFEADAPAEYRAEAELIGRSVVLAARGELQDPEQHVAMFEKLREDTREMCAR